MTWVEGSTEFSWTVPHRFSKGAEGRPLVVALHGMGEHENIMASRLEPLCTRGLSLLVPRAPFPVEIRRADRIRIGYAWYQYDGDDERFVASMARTADYLLPLIDGVAARTEATGVGTGGAARRARNVVLAGFSQGAYLAYFVALRYPARFAGVCGIAGRAKEEVLLDHLQGARHVRVLHLHGADDPTVSADACRESIEELAAAGLDATFRVVPGGHTISREMVEAMAAFVEGSRE